MSVTLDDLRNEIERLKSASAPPITPVTANPKDGTAGNRPRGRVGDMVLYSGKLYFCTNATTPTWEAITSS